MVGSTIKVVATAENGNTFESDETEEVGVYEALEILSADQIHKDQVYVTFSAPISEADEITVTKGAAEKTVSAVLPDDDNLGATLTMKDALSAGTYTVTLTPADEDEDPSSVTFEAITANKVERIEILGDYLVMKDTDFDEGYCFIKGYNHFDEPVTLSGLTVNAAPSSSTQYDSSTGKLTVKSETANQYAIIKQVTVYAQAMVDSKAIVAQKTLEVSSIGYPAEVEFGEITKDSDNASDISDGITINEINSGLYYIPLLSVKDNYGNDMLAKDLNDLNKANLLTTVPTSDTSLYFSVRDKGSVFTEKNGQVVVFLGAGNGKPGTFNFLMTSAGGQFDKEVNIIENPFIDTLDVTLPDIYEYEETEEFGLVGHDQDEHELDLYDYLQAGEFPDKLEFIDQQNLTESHTVIDAGTGNGKWRVQKFADTKTYKVTFVPSDKVKAKGIITFVVTTASFNTDTKMATVGARGTSGNISPELTKKAEVGIDFNQALQFLDANGKKMDRAHNPQYPTFVQTNGTKVTASLTKAAVAAMTDEKIAEINHNTKADGTLKTDDDFKFYYVVSAKDKDTSVKDEESVTQGDGAANGVAGAAGQYYVFLIASQDLNDASKTRIIDSRSFYVSKAQVGDVPVSYTAKVSNKLYTGDQYDKPVEVKVDVTFRNGVVLKDQAASGLSLDGGFKVKDNTISKGTAKGDGTATVSVYLDEILGDRNGDGVMDDGLTEATKPYTNDGAVATCTLTYSDDDPVGTSVEFKRQTQDPNGTKIYGTSWKEDETETVWDLKENVASEITVTDGKLTMTNGNVALDTYTMVVKDQYGKEMTDAKYYINGEQVPTALTTEVNATTQKVLEIKGQSKGSEVSKTWRVNVPKTTTVTAVDTTVQKAPDFVVTSNEALADAIATVTDRRIVVGQNLTLDTDTATSQTLNTDLVVKSGATLTLKGTDNAGTLSVATGKKLTFEDGSYLAAVNTLALNGTNTEKNIILGDMTISVAAGKTLTIDEATGGHVTIKNAGNGTVTFTDSTVDSTTLVLQSGKLILGANVAGPSGAALHVENKTKAAANLIVTNAGTLKSIVSTSETAEAAGPIQVGDGTILAITSAELPKIASGADLTMAANATLTNVPAESGVTVNGVEFATSATDMTVSTTGSTAATVTATSATATVEATEVATGKTTESTVGNPTSDVTTATTTSITTATQLAKAIEGSDSNLAITLDADITGFTGSVNPGASHTIDMNGHSVSGSGTMSIDGGKTITLKGTGTFGPAIEVWNTSAPFDWTSGSLTASGLATEAGVTTSSVEAIITMFGEGSVSAVPSLTGIKGTVSKLTVTAYNTLYTALADATTTIGSGDANKALTISGKTNKGGKLSESATTATLTLPDSFAGATVGSTTVRAGHKSTDYTSLSWVISK